MIQHRDYQGKKSTSGGVKICGATTNGLAKGVSQTSQILRITKGLDQSLFRMPSSKITSL
jgi:hypothetical protein